MCTAEKLHHREMQLSSLIDHIKELEAWRLDGYDGDDVEYILHLLQRPHPDASSRSPPRPAAGPPGNGPNFTAVGERGFRNAGRTWAAAGGVTRPETAWDGHGGGTTTSWDGHGGGTTTSWDGHGGGTTSSHGSNEESPHAELAHALHYASIAMLGLLVIEVRTHEVLYFFHLRTVMLIRTWDPRPRPRPRPTTRFPRPRTHI